MQIDWLTVTAQIVNFLILVWLLKRFLYQPVISAMDRREQRIAEALDSAREREQKAQDNERQYAEKLESVARERRELLALAEEEAAHNRTDLFARAEQDVARQRELWLQQLAIEKTDFLRRIKAQLAASVQDATRKILDELADTSLEGLCVDAFAGRLAGLDDDSRHRLAAARVPLRAMTAFPLSDELRNRLTESVHQHIAPDAEIEFQTDENLLCGIALIAEDYRLDWNADSYLADLEDNVAHLLEAGRLPEGSG